ncbi:hypothetical protein [Bacteroides acidifaciens]|uniref:hypothetical protein n=1 Tax=Bacteroides acidifaciens TaxID=85831 RepID=UPI002675D290|nr:hypothetical protein [Bacteroides acidifaciens]
MGNHTQYKPQKVSSLKDYFMTVLTGGIPMELINEMCENNEAPLVESQEISIDKLWLILRDFAPAVADCLAYDQLILSFKAFDSDENIINSELYPVSNKEAFTCITQFRDDELRFALISLTDKPALSHELYNIVKEGDYSAYKQFLQDNNISSNLLNKRIALYLLNKKSIEESIRLIDNTMSISDNEVGLSEYAYICKLRTASPDLMDERMDNILSIFDRLEQNELISDKQMMNYLEYPLFLIKLTIKEAQNKKEEDRNHYEKKLLSLCSNPAYAILVKLNTGVEDIISIADKNALWSAINIIEEYNDSIVKENLNASETNNQPIESNLQNISVVSKFGSYRHNRLDFPSRLISETIPSPISAEEQGPILKELYNLYGGSFENMSCEEFLYLFGAAFTKKPAIYNPPYYWTGDESTMKAFLRILYTQQPRLLKELILHITDKETGATSHDWGRNKNKVAYREIEANIIRIIHGITKKTLKEL